MVDQENKNLDHLVSGAKSLLFLLGAVLLSTLVSILLLAGIGLITEASMEDLIGGLNKSSGLGERNMARLVVLINHLFTFILPSLAVAWVLYKKDWLRYLGFGRLQRPFNPILGGALMIIAIPITGLLYWLNQQIPLPDILMEMESSTNGLIESILITENTGEIIFNIFIIAVIPAIGEELLFRGHLQQQLSRIFQNQHTGILLAALTFSAIHMQFEGFIPRFALGALLGYLFYWTGNIWVPIIAHFANNAFQIIGVYTSGEDISELNINEIELPPFWQLLIFITLAALLAFYIYKINRGNRLRLFSK